MKHWDISDDTFHNCVRSDRHLPDYSVTSPPDSPQRTHVSNQQRVQILRHLRGAYERLLRNSLQGATWIELGRAEKGDMAFNAPYRLMRVIGQEEDLPPRETSILQAYDDAGQKLLILGEPGAGKSTLLLELALQLIKRAEDDEQHPLPVIVPLSSWAVKRLPLQDWLGEQVSQIYDIPGQLCGRWVNEQRFLPLLDGLDETHEAARPACIAAINAYQRESSGMLAVCSRTAEYAAVAQTQRLMIQRAVSIQPLSQERVDAVLAQAGKPLESLRQTITENTMLRELATTPLMLSAFMLAYHEAPARSLLPEGAPLQQRLWNDYSIQRMTAQKENMAQAHFSSKQSQKWLHWLAKQMQTHHETILLLELLQPDWLPERQRNFYRWSIGLVFGLLGALLCGLIYGLPGMLLGGLVYGLLGALTEKIKPVEAFAWSWRKTRSVMLAGLLFGLLVGLLGALVYTLLGGLSVSLSSGLFLGAIYALFLGLPVGLHVGLIGGLLSGLLVSVVYGFTREQLTERFTLFPNGKMRRSAKNGLLGALIGTLLGALASVLLGRIVFMLIGMLVGGLIYGLRAVVQHLVLRFWLWQSQRFPWRAQQFLNDAADRLLLQRVGSGYSFTHRLLLDYFASLETASTYPHRSLPRLRFLWPLNHLA